MKLFKNKNSRKLWFKSIGVILVITIMAYSISNRLKVFIHHGIWLSSSCEEIKILEYPNFLSLVGIDGRNTLSTFVIQKESMIDFITKVKPDKVRVYNSNYSVDATFQSIEDSKFELNDNVFLWIETGKGDFSTIYLQRVGNKYIGRTFTSFS